jgi:hypothetical protein
MLVAQLAHPPSEQLWAQGSAAGGIEAEHETIRSDTGTAGGCQRVHCGKVLSEEIDGGLVEADCTAAPRLGLLLDDDSAGIVDRSVDDEFLPVEVQPVASHTRQLTASQTGGRCELSTGASTSSCSSAVTSRSNSSFNSGAVMWRGVCVLVGNLKPSTGLLVTSR